MDHLFFDHIFKKHQKTDAVPPSKEITGWALHLIRLLYPEQAKQYYTSSNQVEDVFKNLEVTLTKILDMTKVCQDSDNCQKAKNFSNYIPELYRLLNTDITALLEGDPAAKNEYEVVRTYPGFFAICFYRIAHTLLRLDIPLLPRILTEYAHSRTGIDIHPGAVIGEYLYIDHGTGIVIGETCKIGNHVKLYQGITLGALSVDKSMASLKRHPTVEDRVVIYSGATILGGETVIGHDSIIGGNVWLTRSVPPGSIVYHEPRFKIIERKIEDY